MAKRAKDCTCCGRDLDKEERRLPRKDECGAVICHSCYSRDYEENCSRCGEFVEKTELSSKPGRLIGVWRDAPALGGDVKAGYYRVLRWPIYADGMIEGYFYADALKQVGQLDVTGLQLADEEMHMAGPMCNECQTEAQRRCDLGNCFIGVTPSTTEAK